MASIKQMINSVFPNTFKQDDILEVISSVKQSLNNNSLEAVELAIKEVDKTNLTKDKEYLSMLSAVQRNYPLTKKYNVDLFNHFKVVLLHADDLLDQLESLVYKKFTKVVDKDSMNYQRTQILSLVNTVSLVSAYIPQYIHYLCVSHNENHNESKIVNHLTKHKVEYVRSNMVAFLQALGVLLRTNGRSLKQIMENIPDVEITDNQDELKLLPQTSLDPTGAVNGFLSASTNPFYYFRMWMVDRAHSRYKRNQEEIEAIKIELEAMNSQILNGDVDARTERLRERAQQRLQKLEYEVAQHEEKVMSTQY